MDSPSIDQGAARTAAALREQLGHMSAAAQVLEQNVTDEKSRQYFAVLEKSIYRMLRIVGRLELIERLGGEADSVRMDWQLTDLAQLTRELGARLAQLLEYAGVELTVNAPEWMGAMVDAGLIRQMVMELVSNGAKKGKHVALTLTLQGQRAVFTVEDDGPGILPERLGRLFSGAEEGVPDWRRSGVGIAIARRVVDLHGGAMMADCTPGKGLKVVASIPLGKPGGSEFKTPDIIVDLGGYSEELIMLSDLVPLEYFSPKSK